MVSGVKGRCPMPPDDGDPLNRSQSAGPRGCVFEAEPEPEFVPERDRLGWNVLQPTDRLCIGQGVCSILAVERLIKLRDKQWSKIESLLPPATRTGGRAS